MYYDSVQTNAIFPRSTSAKGLSLIENTLQQNTCTFDFLHRQAFSKAPRRRVVALVDYDVRRRKENPIGLIISPCDIGFTGDGFINKTHNAKFSQNVQMVTIPWSVKSTQLYKS